MTDTHTRDFVLKAASLRAKQRDARRRLAKAEWLLKDGSPFLRGSRRG